MIGATTGRMSANAGPKLERTRFIPHKDTVFILDQKMSILLLDYDPGEGFEVLIPAYTNKETK